jgi:large subunit ribosomal protein L13
MDRKTFQPKPAEVEREWFVVDAEGKTLGRIASVIAHTLRGKHKPTYANHVDVGDFVIVVNAEKIVLTGKKETQKFYYRHSQYPGGLSSISVKDQRERHPDRIIRNAVRGMLPKNVLGEAQFKKLKVYAGSEHPHASQKPKDLAI